MRKYIIGFLAGAVFSVCLAVAIFANVPTAFANEIKSLIGREVQGEFVLTIGGKQLENKAIVIDGTSFAPVREIGEALENKVDFDFEKGITLTKKEEPKVSASPTPTQTPQPTPTVSPTPSTKQKLDALESKINGMALENHLNKSLLNSKIHDNPEDPQIKDLEKKISDVDAEIEVLMKQREELLNQ